MSMYILLFWDIDSCYQMLHPRNPPNPATQIPRYLAVQIQTEILVEFEFVPRNFSITKLDFGGVAFSVESVIYPSI